MDPPEDQTPVETPEPEQIEATLEPEAPVQGPILEPEAIAVYEHEHYLEICRINSNVRDLEERSDRAKSAAKMAKDAMDDARAELTGLISRGPSIPGRQYAKRVRLLREVQANTELKAKFLPLSIGQEFDVCDIDGSTVAIEVQGIITLLAPGDYTVIAWAASPPKPLAPPKKPKTIRMLVTVGNDEVGLAEEGAELPAIVDQDGDVSIALGSEPYPLEPEEFEVIEWETPVDPNGWRLVNIAELIKHGVKPSTNDKLFEAGITTIGKLLDFQRDGTELTSIKGIAGEKEAQIADAMVAFWREHPEWCKNATEAA